MYVYICVLYILTQIIFSILYIYIYIYIYIYLSILMFITYNCVSGYTKDFSKERYDTYAINYVMRYGIQKT